MANINKVSYDDVTESHLSKKYNDLLYDAMMRVNVTGYAMEADPHINHLRPYFSAIYCLYRCTFMLFYNITLDEKGQNKNLAKILFEKMTAIKTNMRRFKKDTKYMTDKNFEEIVETCDIVHMLIMDGLQKRHMLVRLSQNEPRGEETVFYWDEKEAFKKGGINIPELRKNNINGLFKSA